MRRLQQMTAHSEEILHHAVDGREALELSRGLEAAHLAFTLTGGLMRGLRAIVLVLPSNVDHGRHGRAVRGFAAAELVGDQSARFAALALQQLAEES